MEHDKKYSDKGNDEQNNDGNDDYSADEGNNYSDDDEDKHCHNDKENDVISAENLFPFAKVDSSTDLLIKKFEKKIKCRLSNMLV